MQATEREEQPLQWFGSSGIRGPLDQVGIALGLRLGRALGARWRRVVVGHDARLSGPALVAAVTSGLLASGADVTHVGLLPTPALAHIARHHDLGVQVTASHNPAPDNGYKLWLPTGAAPGAKVLADLESGMRSLPPLADWRSTGTERRVPGGPEGYADAVLRKVRKDAVHDRPLEGARIALDCAHGAGATVTPRLLSALGAETTVLGGSPDGRFPDHPSEPTAEHLGRLGHTVRDGTHALGIAHDGDADRTVFLTPDGSLVSPERLLAVLAETRGDTHIALPVDGSGVVADHLPDAEVHITPVGDIHLSRAIGAGLATLACEPSGTWFFGDWSPTPEGPYAAAAVAAHLVRDPGLLERMAQLPTYARATEKVRLPNGWGRAAGRAAITSAAERLAVALEPRSTSHVDGHRLETDDGWVLVRPSGTEPVLRITAEARHEGRARELAAAGRRSVDEALEEAT